MSEKHDAMWGADAGQYIAEQEAEIERLQNESDRIRSQFLDCAGHNAKLRAALENERAYNKRLLAQLENWNLIEMNKENMKLLAVLEEILSLQPLKTQHEHHIAMLKTLDIIRKALAKEGK